MPSKSRGGPTDDFLIASSSSTLLCSGELCRWEASSSPPFIRSERDSICEEPRTVRAQAKPSCYYQLPLLLLLLYCVASVSSISASSTSSQLLLSRVSRKRILVSVNIKSLVVIFYEKLFLRAAIAKCPFCMYPYTIMSQR